MFRKERGKGGSDRKLGPSFVRRPQLIFPALSHLGPHPHPVGLPEHGRSFHACTLFCPHSLCLGWPSPLPHSFKTQFQSHAPIALKVTYSVALATYSSLSWFLVHHRVKVYYHIEKKKCLCYPHTTGPLRTGTISVLLTFCAWCCAWCSL